MANGEERIRAAASAWEQGHDVHIGCGGEAVPRDADARMPVYYYCHECERTVGRHDVAHAGSPAPEEDALLLLGYLDEARAELDALRNNLTVLAAAWGSNANHDPHPGTACAWGSASDALDELLKRCTFCEGSKGVTMERDPLDEVYGPAPQMPICHGCMRQRADDV